MMGKGCSGVETLLFEGMIVAQEVADEGDAEVNVDDVYDVGFVAEGDVSAADDVVFTAVKELSIPSPTPPTPPPQPSQDQPSTSQVHLTSPQAQPKSPQHQPQPLQDDKIAQALEITKLKSRVKKLERRNKASKLQRLKKVGIAQRIETFDDTVMDDVAKQGRMIADMDADVDVSLEDAKEVIVEKSDAEIDQSAEVQGRKAESQVKIYQIDLEHANKVLSIQDDEGEPAELQEVVEVVTTAKLITKVVTAASDTLTAATSQLTTNVALTLTTTPSAARRRKGDNVVKRYQALKRKPQTEAQARKNMMIYPRNVAGFKIDYFKGMTYDDIRPIFEKHFNSNVAFLQKTKEQMDEEDSRALKRLNETTPLACKVPVVDYEIYNENNKPYYKIKRADCSHQLYISFLSLLRNFDKEELETLWRLVKERFATTKPKNFSDDFLLITLGAMFEKPDIQAQIWKNQRSVYCQAKVKSWKLLESCGVQIITFTTTQLILLIERRYPLTRFTLDQMLNNVRLEVEEDSEVSLELLSFGVDVAEDLKEKHAK
nr:hypothetical protein [Tanacetum cinerariifolium]